MAERRRAGVIAAAAFGAMLLLVPAAAPAQVPPSATEVAAWRRPGSRLELQAAARDGDVARIRALLSAPAAAPIDGRDPHGRTALHVATFAGRHDAIRALIAAGADSNALESDRYDPVTIASVANDEGTLRLLLEIGARATNITSRYDGTALIAAAHLGHDGVVRQLIAAGAPLDHVNNLHWTAVIESVVLGDGGPRHQATLRALIDAGANLALTDRNGATPLALARSRGYRAMVEMLERGGNR